MVVTDKKTVPIYEVTCCECKSKIQYKKSEVFTCHIQCPVCGVSLWADTIQPVRYESGRVMDIGLDLERAYDDGYKKGWEEAEAYALHCGDETPITNADRIRSMTDKELAEFLAELRIAPSCTGKCHKDYEIYGELRTFCHDCWLDWLKTEGEQ